MNWIKALVGSLKLSYIIYNFLHQQQLRKNKAAYRSFNLKRPAFFPITHKLLKKLPVEKKPWLDESSLKEVADGDSGFQKLPSKIQKAIINWSEDGYVIIPSLFSEEEVDIINSEIERLAEAGIIKWRYGNKKLMFAYRHSDKVKAILDKPELNDTLSFLLGKSINLFSSINFYKGSEQLAHSDSVHMTTHPPGYLIAAWIALEDIKPDSGPLTYYPGSHKLPYVMNEDFNHGGNFLKLGKEPYNHYEEKIASVLAENDFSSKTFLPKKGDILIWHANLLHGGCPMTSDSSTRKSMVLHYYASDVICYHEITQRPTLWP